MSARSLGSVVLQVGMSALLTCLSSVLVHPHSVDLNWGGGGRLHGAWFGADGAGSYTEPIERFDA